MKIAFVALPRLEDYHLTRIAPPLPLGYLAAILEQQRHIIRVYDLALMRSLPLSSALAPLRAFRPHLVVIASDSAEATKVVEAQLHGSSAEITRLGTPLRELAPGQSVAQALWRIDEHAPAAYDQRVIFEALLALNDDLDSLPFPARHLLSLEQYPLFTTHGELQTTVLLIQQLAATDIAPRNPAAVIAELQSIVREHGIRHFVFPRCPLAHHQEWLNDLLRQLTLADLNIAWEACISYDRLEPGMLRPFRHAGCEVLCFEFGAGEVLYSRDARAALSAAVEMAHSAGISVRGRIELEPLFGAIPAVVDLSATFNLDDVHFVVRQPIASNREPSLDNDLTFEDVAEMARSRYRSSRSRQFFVDKFGPQLGPMLWRVGRAGLLGRTWWRYATGSEDGALVY